MTIASAANVEYRDRLLWSLYSYKRGLRARGGASAWSAANTRFVVYDLSNNGTRDCAGVVHPDGTYAYDVCHREQWTRIGFRTPWRLDLHVVRYDGYPPHVQDLHCYAFKPMLVARTLSKMAIGDVLFWSDAGLCRLTDHTVPNPCPGPAHSVQ